MKPGSPEDNYADFLVASQSKAPQGAEPDLSAIRKELVPSPFRLGFWYLAFSFAGYLTSLLVCAQNSWGLSGFAHQVADAIHKLPDPWCPMVCGAVFTGVPFLLSAVLLTRFQHRYLIFKMWWFFAAIPIVGTVTMIFLPQSLQHHKMAHHMSMMTSRPDSLTETSWIAVWALTAILFPYLLELLLWTRIAPKKMLSLPPPRS